MKTNHKPETKTIIKAIFAWEDEKEEKWLGEMAAQGWKLLSVAPYIYRFVRAEPETAVFRLDYKNSLDKNYQEYLAIFKDAGWELFTTFAGWHYFKANPDNNLVPEIYTSSRMKAQKYKRLLWTILPLMVIMFNPAVNMFYRETSEGDGWFFIGLKLIFGACILFFLYAITRILFKIRNLESETRE